MGVALLILAFRYFPGSKKDCFPRRVNRKDHQRSRPRLLGQLALVGLAVAKGEALVALEWVAAEQKNPSAEAAWGLGYVVAFVVFLSNMKAC